MGDIRRLIAFDLDGTLIDSRRDLADSANELIQELGGEPLSEEQIGTMVGEGARVLVARALAAARLGDDAATALPRFLEIYDTRLLNHTKPYDGVAEMLAFARDHARLAVLTNKPKAPTEVILKGLELRDHFEAIVGGDGPVPRKPDPAGLNALIDLTGASADTALMVGDSVIDFETATRARVRCVIATYGYGFQMFPEGKLTGDEWTVKSPAELREMIQRFANGSS